MDPQAPPKTAAYQLRQAYVSVGKAPFRLKTPSRGRDRQSVDPALVTATTNPFFSFYFIFDLLGARLPSDFMAQGIKLVRGDARA